VDKSRSKIKEVDELFSNHIDRTNRILYVLGTIDDELLYKFRIGIITLLQDNREKDITVHLNTNGGDVYGSFEMYDLIRSMPMDVTIIAGGTIHSAGILVLLAGDKRYALKNTSFMVHEAKDELEGDVQKLKKEIDHSVDLENSTYRIYEERTGTTKKQWKTRSEKTTYFNANKALEFNIIDKIVGTL